MIPGVIYYKTQKRLRFGDQDLRPLNPSKDTKLCESPRYTQHLGMTLAKTVMRIVELVSVIGVGGSGRCFLVLSCGLIYATAPPRGTAKFKEILSKQQVSKYITGSSAHLAVEAEIQATSRNFHHESHGFVTEVTKVSFNCLHVCWFETTS